MFSSINYKYTVDEAVQLMLLAVMFFFYVIGSVVFIFMLLAVISLF